MFSHHLFRVAVVGALALASIVSISARAEEGSKSIDDNTGILIDGKTFQIVPGKAAADTSTRIKSLGAYPLGPAAIIFRSGDKLYIVDTPVERRDSGAPPSPAGEPELSRWIKIEYVPPKNPEHQKV